MSGENGLTARDMAKRLDVPLHRVKYALDLYNIEARERVGIIRRGLCSKTLAKKASTVKIGRVRRRPADVPYKVILKPSADKALSKLPLDIQRRIVGALDALALDPRPHGVAKMAGDDNLWRVRVGEYRIVYEIHDGRLIVLVLRVAHRRDVYR